MKRSVCVYDLARILGLATLGVGFSLASVRGESPRRTTARSVVETYAQVVEAAYRDAYAEAGKLDVAVEDFVAAPNETGLERMRTAWNAARRPYLQTEVFRFYAGPIDDDDGPEGQLNAWPMDEAYVDYVEGDAAAGLINRPDFEITPENIAAMNEKDGEENISTGFHAIEFLLWGQDLRADSPGDRAWTDFTTAPNAERRRQYLMAVSTLLCADLKSLVGGWEADARNYRHAFENAPGVSVQKILTGMAMLSGFELAGERLLVAYDTQAQEDEHSCFSDTTHLDVIYDIQGILNVWEGTYGKIVDGAGVSDLAHEVDRDLAKALDRRILESVALAKAVPAPFDQAILGDDDAPGRVAIMALIESLEEQGDLLAELGEKLGMDVPTEETDG